MTQEQQDKEAIATFRVVCAAAGRALSTALRHAADLPVTEQREYYVSQCKRHIENALTELNEVDGGNGYLTFVEDPSKIAANQKGTKL
jgi:hypothetical protein